MLRTCLVLADETVEFLHSGCSLIVGIVGDDGAPLASRGWGLTVLEPDGSRLRLIGVEGRGGASGPSPSPRAACRRSGRCSSRATLVEIEAMTEADQAKCEQYADDFMQDITDTDGVPRYLLERIFPAAQGRVHRRRRRDVRPDAGPARRCAAVVSDDDVPGLADLRLCFEGAVPAVIATASAAGVPNVTYLSRVRYVDDEHVALSNQFFSKTSRNLAENPRASMLLVDPTTYDEFRLTLVFERTVNEGPGLREAARGRRRGRRAPRHAGRVQAARRRHLPGARHRAARQRESRESSGRHTRRRSRWPAGLAELVARLSRCPDLDTLVGATVDGLDELLGYPHSLLLLLDEEGGRLFTIASHGYAAEGVGSEVPVGEGTVGNGGGALRRRSASGTSARCASTRRRCSARSRRRATSGRAATCRYPGIESAESRLAVPAIALGQLVGVLMVESERSVAFDEADESLLGVVASFVASAIEIDRSRERRRRRPRPSPPPESSRRPERPRRTSATSRSTAASSSTATTSSRASRAASCGRCSSSTSRAAESSSRTKRCGSIRARAARLPRQPRQPPHPPQAPSRRARRADPHRKDRPRPLPPRRRRRRDPRRRHPSPCQLIRHASRAANVAPAAHRSDAAQAGAHRRVAAGRGSPPWVRRLR